VTLGETVSDGAGFWGERKMGSFQAGFRGVLGGGGWMGWLLGFADGVLKSCVKLPSPDAEPETPGEENPFACDTLGAGMGFVSSSLTRGGAAGGGFTPPTKILVNSPGPRLPWSAGAWAGVLTGAVGVRF
jgi:hypothetical protein